MCIGIKKMDEMEVVLFVIRSIVLEVNIYFLIGIGILGRVSG